MTAVMAILIVTIRLKMMESRSNPTIMRPLFWVEKGILLIHTASKLLLAIVHNMFTAIRDQSV